MNRELEKLPTPAVVIHMDIVEKNVSDMLEGARRVGLKHRPHIKTHRSGYLAGLQVEAGCSGITAAKLGEAEVMAEAGIQDIFIAYPLIGEDKLQRLLDLSGKVKVSTLVNSAVGAGQLSDFFEKAHKRVDVLIEIDGGLNRGGVKPGKAALEFARSIRELAGIRIVGLMYYGGLVYNSRNIEEIRQYAREERDTLLQTAKLLEEDGFRMEVLSAGSSFTGKVPEELRGITEIRSGHYIFNDCGQIDAGLVKPDDCALRVLATVVSKPDEHVVIADVGTKSLTGDVCHYRKGYGWICGYPEVEIYALNEEHAFLRCEAENPLQIGDKIEIIPNHACVVTNLVDRVDGFYNGKFRGTIEIDARGRSE